MMLTEQEFKATFRDPMKRVVPEVAPPCDFWDYYASIPTVDFEGHDCSNGVVDYVWESSEGAFQHVLVNSESKNVFMAIVLDVAARHVIGHRLLNLEREYGLAE